MPAILGPGSVSLETCAETRKLDLQNLFPPAGLFLRNRLSKRLTRKLKE